MLTVLAWPSRVNAADNTYTSRLSSSLEQYGVQVDEFSIPKALFGHYDLIHVHWPEGVLKKRGRLVGAARVVAVVSVLFVARFLRRRRVVWTVHNLEPHDLNRPHSLALLRCGLGLLVDGYIHLSHVSEPILARVVPKSVGKRRSVIPIGRYSGEFSPLNNRADTRRTYGVGQRNTLVVFAGQVAPYKGALELAQVAHASPDAELRLVIAGRSIDREYANEINELAAQDTRISFLDERLDSGGLADIMYAADLVAYPYRTILNSASILAPLETRTPVLAPAVGAISEMSDRVGRDWIRTYVQPLTDAKLSLALSMPLTSPEPDLSTLEWSEIGRATLSFYRSVLALEGDGDADEPGA